MYNDKATSLLHIDIVLVLERADCSQAVDRGAVAMVVAPVLEARAASVA